MNKKIGIWGFGVVGQSALTFFDQHNPTSIEILNKAAITLPATTTPVILTLQDEQSILDFLGRNDLVLASPGIPLHNYQQFANKFISELDLYQEYNPKWPTIAITGSLGKTTVTHLLTKILQVHNLNAVAAGNIGDAMLNLVTPENLNKKENLDAVVLELSSFQLQQAQKFAPDLAIITNIYPNHLDHHKDMEEYINAKSNIYRQQHKQKNRENYISLLPLQLMPFEYDHFFIRSNWKFFSATQPTDKEWKDLWHQHVYYLSNSTIYLRYEDTIQKIFDISTLPTITFDENWLIIIATLHIHGIDLTNLASIAQDLSLPDHRVQNVGSSNGSNFYNDSKSTVWQATLQAVSSLDNKPIKLFVGGLSKGADRTPLFQALAGKHIEIYCFGQEAEQLAQLCAQFKLAHHAYPNLDTAWNHCIINLQSPHEILFSPGGSSFDLYADYKARGQHFTQLVHDFCKTKK